MVYKQISGRKVRSFALDPKFLAQFAGRQPNWGFGGLGYFVYKRSYALNLPDGGQEEFWQTCQRVVEGIYYTQKVHCRRLGLPWSEPKAQRCLPEGTGVHLVGGLVPIEQVKVGDRVQTVRGIGKVTNVWDQGEQETIQINTPVGVLECTSNHQVAVFRENLFSWEFVRAGDLEEGDRLVFDACGYEGGDTTLPMDASVEVPALTPDIAWLMGEIHGDGSVQVPVAGGVNGSIRLRIEHDRPRLEDAVRRAVEALSAFGHEPKVYENDTVEVKLFSRTVASYFHQHVKQANCPLRVPSWIWGAPQEVRSAYVAGLFDADGSCRTRPLVVVTTIYEDFAQQIRHLCGSLGIATYVVTLPPGVKSPRSRYNVCLKGYENIERFRKGVGRFSTKLVMADQQRTSKKTHSFPISAVRATFGGWDGENKDLATYRISERKDVRFSALPVEVISIDPGRLVRTYDIEVEGLQQFTVAGGFVVHNSAQEMFQRMWDFKFTPPGRGLAKMGTDAVGLKGGAMLNNPLHEDTPVLTREHGWVPLGSLVGREDVTLLSSTKLYGRDHTSTASKAIWTKASVSHVEVQPCKRIVLRDNSGFVTEIVASENHRWFRRGSTEQEWERVTTLDLNEGDQFPVVLPAKVAPVSHFGAQHGLFFGSGTLSNGELHQSGGSVAVLRHLFGPLAEKVDHRREDERVVRNCPRSWAQVPTSLDDISYIYGFLAGYFAADGCVQNNGACSIASALRSELEDVRRLFQAIGVRVSEVRLSSTSFNSSDERMLWAMTLHTHDLWEGFFLRGDHRERWGNRGPEPKRKYAEVIHIEDAGDHRVLCAVVPDYEQFVIDGFLLTSNCAFTSTNRINEDFAGPFTFLMDMSMLGVGVGGDTRGAGKVKLSRPKTDDKMFVVEDSREGWVALVKTVLNSFVGKGQFPAAIDFRNVRPKGVPLKTFGGKASGPGPLRDLVKAVTKLLTPQGVEVVFEESEHEDRPGEPGVLRSYFRGRAKAQTITSSQIVDVFNMIGKCVVAGGIRRCLPRGTLVHTTEGLIPIEEVKTGMSVVTSQGSSLVTDWVEQGVQPISQVTTQMGTFEATDKHKIAVLSDIRGGYTWKMLRDLEPGDRMVFVDRVVEGSQTSFSDYEYEAPDHSTTCKGIQIPALDKDTAWLLGLIAGDGYVRLTSNSGQVSVSVAEGQEDIRDQAAAVLSRFGVHVSVNPPKEGNACHVITVKSKQLADFLSQYKKPHTPLQVPEIILRGLPEVRAAYVAGLLDADGSARNRPLVVAASVYPSYLEQVQAVLASLGIPSRFRQHKDKTRAEKGWQSLYHLTVVGEKARTSFEKRVAIFSLKYEEGRKTPRSQHDYGFPSQMVLDGGVTGYKDGQMRWSRTSQQITVGCLEDLTGESVTLVPVEVLEVEHGVREDETYDISVGDAREFVAQGGYLVHNTAEIMFGDKDDFEFVNLKDASVLSLLYEEKGRLEQNLAVAPTDELAARLAEVQEQISEHPVVSHRWSSNNSIFGEVGMDYTEIAGRIAENGEPGVFWLKNAQAFGRMMDPPDYKDEKALGCNPCFTGDTLIATADGRGAVSIRQLVDEGNDVPVYSMDPKTGKIEIKMARNPRQTRESAPLVEVELDDGSAFRVTPDHKMVLLDGTQCEAQDLQPGDSLPRFQKRLERVKKGGKQYVRVYCNTRDQRKDKVFEHRLIAQFHDPDKWESLYDEAKQAGWVKGGLVVHHNPHNLDIQTFRDHARLHGEVDNRGEKNPMWGRSHSDSSKRVIGRRTKERCSDPVFLAKLSASHTQAEREAASDRMSDQRKAELLSYYKEQDSKTDLDTVWMEDRLYAVRQCETCGEEFVVPWGKRGQSYCSYSCKNKAEDQIQKRKAGQAVVFADRQRQTLHQQVQVFKALGEALSRTPMKKEWEDACRGQGVPFRLRKDGSTSNPYALTSYSNLQEIAANYNHRVKAVRHLDMKEPVYNLSVTDHHTVCLVTSGTPEGQCSGVSVFQCAEQTLEPWELCCLVETYPAHHEDYADFERTLKFAYLYAKTVTLTPTHDPRTNAVMNRNRRIGCSMSGIRQAIEKVGRREFLRWSDQGYGYIQKLDKMYSDWLGIPRSIKTTSVKPSGCRPWYALTSTNQGLLTLEDLFEHHPADQEWSSLPDTNTRALRSGIVSKTYNNGVTQVLRITTSYGIEVESTPNHQWWVTQRYDREKSQKYQDVNEWRRADEIQPGDILDIQPGVYDVETRLPLLSLNSLAVNMCGDAKEIRQPKHMNPRLAWLLGYLWGDGAMSPSKYRLRWVDARHENLAKAQAVLKEQFGLDTEIKQASEHRKAETLEVGSKHLWHWLIRNNVFKLYADKIDLVPKVVRASAQEDILAFLAGLLDSDGWAGLTSQGAKLVWTTSDEFFARHVQDVALAVGLVLGRSHVVGGQSFQNQRSMWHLTQSAHVDARAFEMFRRHSTKVADVEARSDFFGWHCDKKEMTSGRLILGKVLKVESVGEMPTYDVEVADKHWYYAGAIKSHNTVSLLCGATPGIHLPHSEFYIRNIRVSATSPFLQACRDAGYKVEPDVYAPDTFVISFPVQEEHFSKSKKDASIWEQMALAADLQRYWADNQVSCTVSFKSEERGEIQPVLEVFEDRLKAISMLPLKDHGYRQAPYIEIDEATYNQMVASLKPLNLSRARKEVEDRFCTTDVCEIRSFGSVLP